MTEPDPKLEIVTIFESDDPVAFSLARGLLDEAGVEYAVSEDRRGAFGLSPILMPIRRIHIPAYRKEQALELMESAPELGDFEAEDDFEGEGGPASK